MPYSTMRPNHVAYYASPTRNPNKTRGCQPQSVTLRRVSVISRPLGSQAPRPVLTTTRLSTFDPIPTPNSGETTAVLKAGHQHKAASKSTAAPRPRLPSGSQKSIVNPALIVDSPTRDPRIGPSPKTASRTPRLRFSGKNQQRPPLHTSTPTAQLPRVHGEKVREADQSFPKRCKPTDPAFLTKQRAGTLSAARWPLRARTSHQTASN